MLSYDTALPSNIHCMACNHKVLDLSNPAVPYRSS